MYKEWCLVNNIFDIMQLQMYNMAVDDHQETIHRDPGSNSN